jgi:RND superfamily putative drug exporter
MVRFCRLVLRYKALVAVFWLIMTIVGFAFVQQATNALSQQYSLPGQQAYETNITIAEAFHNGGSNPPIVPVITLPKESASLLAAGEAHVEDAFQAAAGLMPGYRFVWKGDTGSNAFHSADGRTIFGLVYLPSPLGFSSSPGLHQVESFFLHKTVQGAPFEVTGIEPLATGSGNSGGPGVLIEALIGGIGALIVLALVFRSFMALIPLLMAIVAIPTTFMVIWGLTTVTSVSFIVQFLVALIGLGVAIDYSLLIVIRWREERAKGVPNDEAVVTAMQTAGVAVVFSGTTVAIGLLALIAIPVPFLQSVGYGGMLIPLISVIIALTLLPAILGSIGPTVDWPRPRAERVTGTLWTRWGRLVVRRRWLGAGVAIAILLVLFIPFTHINIGDSQVNSLSKSGQAFTGLQALEHSGIGAGALTPFDILHDTSKSSAALTPPVGVRDVVVPQGRAGETIFRNITYQDLIAIPQDDGDTSPGIAALNALESEVDKTNGAYVVAGYSAQNRAFVTAVYGNFPLMILIIVIITFVLLMRAFRSILLPLKAVILNLFSLAAAWGVMTFVWQEGHGSKLIWGVPATGAITAWVPLMVFAFLFGLSMDYEVFILSRTREEYDKLGSTNDAIIMGIGKTGRLVTSAALILFLAFVSLGTAPLVDIKVLATGLAVGILLDATVIRSLLVPSLVSLFGKWNWWLPAPVAAVLRVKPSELKG